LSIEGLQKFLFDERRPSMNVGTHHHPAYRGFVLTLMDREDAGLRISSPDIPGLLLSGDKPSEVWKLVPWAVKNLLAENLHIEVVEVFLPSDALEGIRPRNVPFQVKVVVELIAA
jgi:hypothetical protein